MARIYHLIPEGDWHTTRGSTEWRHPSLAEEGFIHCSKDWEQLERVVRRLYPGRSDMVALEVDTEQLEWELVWEPSRSGEVYPHIYGPLNLSAVVQVWKLGIDDDDDLVASPA